MKKDSVITDVDFVEKKRSERPADPVLLDEPKGGDAQQKAHERFIIKPFADGHIFKYTHHPKSEGQFVLFNSDNMPVGVISSQPVADLICQAVQMLFAAAAVAKAQGEELLAKQKLAQQAAASAAAPPVMES